VAMENEGCSPAENVKGTPVTLDNLVMGGSMAQGCILKDS
jgi:hypothetical protein